MADNDFEVRNAEVEQLLKALGVTLGEMMPANYGFTLLIFEYGEKGNMFYISKAKREDMIESMKEFIKKNERRN